MHSQIGRMQLLLLLQLVMLELIRYPIGHRLQIHSPKKLFPIQLLDLL